MCDCIIILGRNVFLSHKCTESVRNSRKAEKKSRMSLINEVRDEKCGQFWTRKKGVVTSVILEDRYVIIYLCFTCSVLLLLLFYIRVCCHVCLSNKVECWNSRNGWEIRIQEMVQEMNEEISISVGSIKTIIIELLYYNKITANVYQNYWLLLTILSVRKFMKNYYKDLKRKDNIAHICLPQTRQGFLIVIVVLLFFRCLFCGRFSHSHFWESR